MGTPASDHPPVRPEIATAWRRARLSGLDPGSGLAATDLADVNPRSRLLLAAQPVLDDAERQLADTRYSLLLADRNARIVDRRLGIPELERALDSVLAVPGVRYCEETTGTNALASTYETRERIAVHGDEHFLEALKAFTCHGSPIIHPVTGRLEGVLDVTGYTRDANPLLATIVDLAAREIEKRLADSSGERRRAMLHAFTIGTSRTRRPVIVFGDGLTLENDPASDLLDGTVRAALRDLAEHAAGRGGGQGRLVLPAGGELAFVCRPVDGAPLATLVEIVDHTGTPRRSRAGDLVVRPVRRRVLVSGEAGTGRTHAALAIAEDARILDLDPDAPHRDAADLAEIIAGHDGVVLLEHLHLLDDRFAVRLGRALDRCPHTRVVATTEPLTERAGPRRSLLARFDETIELTPLRLRRNEIPDLARRILSEATSGPAAALTPAAMRVLMRWPWPGNVQELATVLRTAATRRPGADLLPHDLGLGNRTHRERTFSPLEEAEADTIQGALRRTRGNKTHAAEALGISRTTLYRRMLALGLGD